MSDLEEAIRQLAIAQVQILEKLKRTDLLQDGRVSLMMSYYIKLDEAKRLAFELLKRPDGIR